MTWRLVSAQLWRVRWHLGFVCFLGANGSYAEGFMARFMMAMPILSAVTGLTGLGVFWARDVRILPIPQRVALRSAWVAALGFPLAIMVGRLLAVAVELALGAAVTRGIETIALAAMWETAFVGVSLTIMQGDDVPWDGVRGAVRRGGYAKTLLPMLWIVVPFAAYDLIQGSVAEVSWLHLAGLVTGAVITVWPLVTKPDQWPALGILHDAPRTSTAPPSTIRKPSVLDRLMGMRRLLPGPVGSAALIAAVTLATSTALTVSLEDTPSLFSAGTTDMEFFLIGGPFFLLFLGPLGWANGVVPFLRSLKTLPISAMRLVVTMTVLPLMMPLFYWTLATGTHLLFGTPGDTLWRLGSFALLGGVFALSAAVYARLNSALVVAVGWFVPVVGAFLLMLLDKSGVNAFIAIWFPVIGAAGVSAAFLLNYRTITRSVSAAAVYRPPPGAALYRGGH